MMLKLDLSNTKITELQERVKNVAREELKGVSGAMNLKVNKITSKAKYDEKH